MLERYAATPVGPWYVRHAAGLACVVVGAISLLVAFWVHFGGGSHDITEVTDLRVSMPLLVLAILAGGASFARRERNHWLPIVGMALALAAPLIGWLILVAIVAIIAIVVMLVIAKFH